MCNHRQGANGNTEFHLESFFLPAPFSSRSFSGSRIFNSGNRVLCLSYSSAFAGCWLLGLTDVDFGLFLDCGGRGRNEPNDANRANRSHRPIKY
jgi:hypothetical protein